MGKTDSLHELTNILAKALRHKIGGIVNPNEIYAQKYARDADMLMIIDALKAQDMAYYRTLKQKTGSPGGNPDYWGSNYLGSRPSDAEWVAAADELFAASLEVGVMSSSGGSGDVDQKIATHAANPDAHHA